jgi:steroid delta-isomerase-like uncharacterized protein
MERTTRLEEYKRTARQFPELVATEGKLDLIDDICTADVVDHSPMGEIRGREALKAQMTSLRAAFADFSATVDHVVAEDDTVAMRVTLRGTHAGPFMGIEPTGAEFEVPNTVFTRFEDGRIAERWVLPDMLGLYRQLGIDTLPTE